MGHYGDLYDAEAAWREKRRQDFRRPIIEQFAAAVLALRQLRTDDPTAVMFAETALKWLTEKS